MRVSRNVLVLLLAACAAVGSIGVVTARQAAAPAQAPTAATIERGRYLVTIQDCNGCHTPFKDGAPDMTRMLSGHPQDMSLTMPPPRLSGGWLMAVSETNTAWAGPWGVSYTTNLTPDRATGIGVWTEQMFINAIRLGKKGGSGRELLPPMPWQTYAKMTDDDLKAMFAYLRSIPAMSNRVPNSVVASPAR